MSSGMVQISALAGCASLTVRYAIQFVIVIWSLRADEDGREHALRLLRALRGKSPERKPRRPAAREATAYPPPRVRSGFGAVMPETLQSTAADTIAVEHAEAARDSDRRDDDLASSGILQGFGGTTEIQKEIIARNLGLQPDQPSM